MAHKSVYDIDLADEDPNGICLTQTPAGAGAMTINGALASGGTVTLDYARQVCVVSNGNDSGVTFTVVGTDADGWPLTEVITGPNNDTAEGSSYFVTISSVTISGAGTGDITVGTVDESSTKTIPLDWHSPNAALINVDVTGTINFTVQETYDEVLVRTDSPVENVQWINITALASKTADTTATATVNATGMRLIVNSYSSGAELQMTVIQSPQWYT